VHGTVDVRPVWSSGPAVRRWPRVFRAEHGRALARPIGLLGDLDLALAEEALADAYSVAAACWPRDRVPEFPAAWLVTTARPRAVDRIRRQLVHLPKLPALADSLETVARRGRPGEKPKGCAPRSRAAMYIDASEDVAAHHDVGEREGSRDR
jgi:DNA-directed RNA polymerase specialized sigma24 family protein